MKNQKLKQHPLSSFFCDLSKRGFKSLKDSISKNGVLDPIVIADGMILDGWHRYKAALELEIMCPFVYFSKQFKGINIKEFVIAQNKDRKDLSKSQIAFAATQVSEWQASVVKKANLEKMLSRAPLIEDEISQKSDTSKLMIQRSKQVIRKGSNELKEAIKQGKIPLKKASEISLLPKREQSLAISSHIGRTKRSKSILSLLNNEEKEFTKQGKYYRIRIREVLIDSIFEERKNLESKRKRQALNRSHRIPNRGFKSAQKTP